MTNPVTNPFGNPDGSRADLEEILEGFVSFGNEIIWKGLAIKDDDRRARIIVGRKGSGKTVYLRRLHANAAKDHNLYADDLQQGPPTTEDIVRFCQLFPPAILREQWIELWHRAIMRSVISHLLTKHASGIGKTTLDQIRNDYTSILGFNYKTPVSAYSQVRQIIEEHHTANAIRTYFASPLWDQLEYTIADSLKSCPPFFFYIDAIDEIFEHAPMYWLNCQMGLFYETMRLLRDPRLGGRLHIVISIRDLVMSSVMRSENRTKFIEEPHIRILNWNRHAIEYLLNEKVKMLDDQFFVGDLTGGKTLSAWLGQDIIHNQSRSVEEPISQYLLRHTRLLPRDIIILGNRLCTEIQRARKFTPIQTVGTVIRQVVSDTSKLFGDEQLAICGNQIASDTMPQDAGRREYSEIYTSDKEYRKSAAAQLKTLISYVGKDRFSRAELDESRRIAADLYGDGPDPYSVMWQNGLLGYMEKRGRDIKAVFYSEERMDEFRLPFDKEDYVFHACMIDSVGIKAIGDPVISF